MNWSKRAARNWRWTARCKPIPQSSLKLWKRRYPFSAVKDANVLVFPSLESANIAYKLLARLGKAKAIGPILLGMGAPIHVLQTGDEVNNIVQIAAVAVMDAMDREEMVEKKAKSKK